MRENGKIYQWRPRNNQLGPNDIIIAAIDERGATTAHEFKIHAFENPSARQFVNTGWPLMLTFVGMMFAGGEDLRNFSLALAVGVVKIGRAHV